MEEAAPPPTPNRGWWSVRTVMLLAAGAMVALVMTVVALSLGSDTDVLGARAPGASEPGPSAPGASGGVACQAPPDPQESPTHFASAPDPSVAQDGEWDVTLHTTCGDIGLLLDGHAAPKSVASFVTLARAGYWHDSVCHRLTTKQAPTAFLQCGDPTGRSRADPGYDLPVENTPADRHYALGTVGVARGDGFPSTSGEFFMVHRDFTLEPDHVAYSVIGRVVSGQDVVEHIAHEGGEDTRPDGPPFLSISIIDVDVARHR
ncbi:peptidylprolyl isomerase [Monashia sp. NPDC004114]